MEGIRMARKAWALLTLFLLACLVLVWQPSAAQQMGQPTKPKWEYQILDETSLIKLSEIKGGTGVGSELRSLNKLGEEGWELVMRVPRGPGPADYYFKRQKLSFQPVAPGTGPK
jgi:hypothetical protein